MGQYYQALVKTDDGTRRIYSSDSAYRTKFGEEEARRVLDERHAKSLANPNSFVPFPNEYYCYYEGQKLAEHARFLRYFVNGVLESISDGPARVAWVGDYANEEEDFELVDGYEPDDYEAIWNDENDASQTFDRMPGRGVYGYLVNLDKGVYIDLTEVAMVAGEELIYSLAHPLPILTAIGNGRGGGDYWGSNMDKVGMWAMNHIQFMEHEPVGFGFVRGETDDYIFEFGS
jgi:hypothetical protein